MSGIGIGIGIPFGKPPSPIEFLLRELFTTAESAPLATPRTCVPGPGEINFVDDVIGAEASMAGGFYQRPRPTDGQAWTDYGFYSTTSFERAPGLFFYSRASSTVLDRVIPLSASPTAALSDSGSGFFDWQSLATLALKELNAPEVTMTTALTSGATYHFLLRARTSGWDYFFKGGSQFPDWTLLWVNVLSNTSPLYVHSSNYNAQLSQDNVIVGRLTQAPFHLDYGIATYFDPVPVDGNTAVGEDDGLTYLTWRPETAETLLVRFRRTDNNNCYRLECSQAAGTIKLFRVESGSDTELDSGKTQTWTAGTAYRIGIQHVGGAISTRVNNTLKHSVTGESFNLTETGVQVAGFATGSYLEIYPRTNPTGWALLSQIEAL